jgi:hypothetical protein
MLMGISSKARSAKSSTGTFSKQRSSSVFFFSCHFVHTAPVLFHLSSRFGVRSDSYKLAA